jgi:endonuclease YncB( thermonuclease family)
MILKLFLIVLPLFPFSQEPPPGVTFPAEVQRVVDGDTVDVSVKLILRIRILDCWAPEKNTPEGKIASQALKDLLPKGTPIKFHVPLEKAKKLGDVLTFGRVLANIWKDSIDIGQTMVHNGYATKTKR